MELPRLPRGHGISRVVRLFGGQLGEGAANAARDSPTADDQARQGSAARGQLHDHHSVRDPESLSIDSGVAFIIHRCRHRR